MTKESDTVATTFVLGAGFSAAEQFPLVRGLKERVVHYLEAERHSAYAVFLEPGNGDFARGQFYAGLDLIDADGSQGFEEILVSRRERLQTSPSFDPCCVTRKVLMIGCARLLYRRAPESFNAATCWSFLRSLRRVCRNSHRQVLVILDNAKFHHALLHQAWRQEVAPGFSLDFLPPYSPELNPIERVWKLTRRRCLHNRYFPLLSELVQDVEQQFQQWACGNETLRRLCAII